MTPIKCRDGRGDFGPGGQFAMEADVFMTLIRNSELAQKQRLPTLGPRRAPGQRSNSAIYNLS